MLEVPYVKGNRATATAKLGEEDVAIAHADMQRSQQCFQVELLSRSQVDRITIEQA